MLLGKLIPAGTGMKRYRNIHLDSESVMSDVIPEFDEEYADMVEDIDLEDVEELEGYEDVDIDDLPEDDESFEE